MGIFVFFLIICGVVAIYAIAKLCAGIQEYKSVFTLNSEEVKAVNEISDTEIRSEKSMNMLLLSLKPKVLANLTSPSSAVICPSSELSFERKDGKFIVKGYVDSQNGFGAMKRANFRAKCVYYPNGKYWMVENIFLYE